MINFLHMQTTQDILSGLQSPELLKIGNNFLCTILTAIRWNSLEWNQQKRDSLNSSWCPNQVIQWFYSELMVGNKLYLEIFLRSDIKAIQIWFIADPGCQSSQYSKRPFTLILIGLLGFHRVNFINALVFNCSINRWDYYFFSG